MASESRPLQLGAWLLSASVCGSALAVDLPRPCAAGLCGPQGPAAFVGAGAAGATQTANQLTVNQTSASAVLNWSSFNISADGKVQFNQPDVSSTAINRIFQADPSKIFGLLNANGHIYLINQNGILFGAGSQVNVGGLVASSLDISPAALNSGIARAAATRDPAFQPFTDSNGKPLPSGPITIQSKATITANGGQVLVFAPSVENDGLIQSPDGQTILAAGQRVFLADSTDPNVRGLLVEVGNGGTVTNGGNANGLSADALGQIVAARGNVTLAGLAVNQNGRVSASTTVRANGSIMLQAVDTSVTQLNTANQLASSTDREGTLTVGAGSTTSVTLEGGPSDTAVDSNTQPQSQIALQGQNVAVLDHATLVAPHGNISVTALVDPKDQTNQLGAADAARVSLAPTSVIDVAGAAASLPASDNSLAVQLRASELANFPANRNGPLHGETVYVDLRAHGTNPDGSTWIGTPVADVSGDIAAIQRDVFERNLKGGTISIVSSGSVLAGRGATLNISGGQIDWQSGYVKSSLLLGADGKTYDIANADPNRAYLGTLDSMTVADPRWGTSVTLALPGHDTHGEFQPGYVQGADSGTVAINAPTVALDGNIIAATTRGPLQRVPAAAITADQFRSPDEIPLGGTLLLGNPAAIKDPTGQTEGMQSVIFEPGFALDSLTGSAGGAFNLRYDPLPSQLVTRIRPDLLGVGGITQLTVSAEGQITLPADTTLNVGAGGSVDLEAGRILDNGSIAAPAGKITLVASKTPEFDITTNGLPAPAVLLNSGAQLSVAGTWVNDEVVAGSQRLPLFTSGGSISITANQASLTLPAGVLVDASAGAQMTSAGKLIGGSGGSINLVANPGTTNDPRLITVFDPTLRGYALASGGSLSLALPTLCISNISCSSPGAMRLAPSLLTDDGFGTVRLTSNLGSLTVEQDVDLAVSQKNLSLLPGAIATRPSGTSFESLTIATLLPAYLRHPENLTLSTTSTALVGVTRSDSALTIAPGAQLSFDPQAAVGLNSDFRIFANGNIIAPAGSVALTIAADVSNPAFRPYQGIWLGPASIIDVSGVALHTPNNLGLQSGSVLPGGSIGLDAQYGYLVALPGSRLTAAGTTAAVDIPAAASTTGGYSRQNIASSGGSVALFAAEGLFFSGAFDARSGGAGAAGGSLTVALDGSLNGGRDVTFAAAPRVLDVTAFDSPIVADEGVAIPVSLNGVGRIAAPTIDAGGFDDVGLIARDLRTRDVNSRSFVADANIGAVQFEPGVILSPGARLVVDSPEIRAVGAGEIALSSGYISLGSSDVQAQQVAKIFSSGSGSLDVSAGFVDLVGDFDLQGFRSATIASASDIRMVGVSPLSAQMQPPSGFVATPGDLTLAAQQIYPATLTSYAVYLTSADPSATLHILGKPGTRNDVLSAGGSLLLQAPSIVNSGTVRAPFGSISLQGGNVTSTDLNGPVKVNPNGDVTLAPGSVLSVSADGLTIPFGTTQAGSDWVYQIQSGAPGVFLVYGAAAGQLAPPQKTVSISAGALGFQSGAKVDLAGGGDLLAYEWIPGPGGTSDYLSSQTSPHTFAVLPGYRLSVAPLDAMADTGFTLQPGDSVYLAGGGGLAAGTYTLLPPRYALLPGAFLVTPVNGFADLTPGQQVPQLDGSSVVSGRLVNGATGLGVTRASGFDVATGALALARAQYTTTSGNSFFQGQAQSVAAAASTASNTVVAVVPQLPQDAGALAIQVGRSLSLAGTLSASAAAGGRGAAFDLSTGSGQSAGSGQPSSTLIVGQQAGVSTDGAVTIDAQQLDSLGAASILLGGIRTFGPASTSVAVNSDNVEVAPGVSLSAPEVMLVANGKVSLDSTSTVKAAGTTLTSNEALQVPDGTAMLRVSTGPQAQVSSPSSGSALHQGQLMVADGATLSAPGSLLVQAGGAVDFSGNIVAAGAAVRLGANQIGIGDVADNYNGFAIRAPLIAGLAGSNLELDTQNAIQLFGAVDLNLSRLELKAPGLSGAGGAALNITAQQVGLQEQAGQQPVTAAAATGSLQVNADSIDLGPGMFALSGFSTSQISAAHDLSVSGDGSLSAAGDLSLNAGVFQSTGAFDYAITAAGHLATASPAAVTATKQSAAGGAITFAGADVALGGDFFLPSGHLSAESTGVGALMQVMAGATVDLAGRSVVFDGKTVSSAGGSLALISDTGSISIAPSAVLEISSGGGSAPGGSLSLSAPDGNVALGGTVHGTGGTNAAGASLSLGARSFDFASLLSAGMAGGLTGDWDIRLRGPGDLVVGAGDGLRATSVALAADQGSVRVLGGIDVSGELGGAIELSAQQDVEVAGTLRTSSLTRADRGGSITLESAAGGVSVDNGAMLTLGGSAADSSAVQNTGSVWIRAPQDSVLSATDADAAARRLRVDGAITGAGQITVEGYTAYQAAASGLLGDSLAGVQADAASFIDQAFGVAAALANNRNLPIRVVPGIEIWSAADLTVNTPLDLSGWRFGPSGVPGVLTLRAAGNLNINASISDGLAADTLLAMPASSWSYRLAAGADLASANPLAVVPSFSLPTGAGSVVLAPGTPGDASGVGTPIVVRTGTGNIDIAAAHDLVLGNQASVIYTAGQAGGGTFVPDDLAGLTYPVNGGSVDIRAGRDIVGAVSNQLFTDWLWRTGAPDAPGSFFIPTAWTIAFDRFEQGVGALGGGDLSIRAGHDISDLGAVVPSIGVPLSADGGLTELNDGVLTVQAGNDIRGGKFLDMAGSAAISAGGGLTSGAAQSTSLPSQGVSLNAVLALGDSQFDVSARRSATIETVLNPTLLLQSNFQNLSTGLASFFSTYTDHSTVSIESAGGGVTLVNDSAQLGLQSALVRSSVNLLFSNQPPTVDALRTYAPTLEVAALGGDVNVAGSMDLWPAAHGNLDLLATGGIAIGNPGASTVHVILSDADPTKLPTASTPAVNLQGVINALDTSPLLNPPGFYADHPVHGGAFAGDSQPDPVPARIVGLTGDVSLLPSDAVDQSLMFIAKPLDVVAGRDIVDLGLLIQQFAAANVSAISAGRDFVYPSPRTPTGQLSVNTRTVDVSGPGELEISAGRNVTLGTSAGITSDGNLLNPALPAGGADISVIAGVSGPPPDSAFIDKYLGAASAYSAALVDYVETVTGEHPADAVTALAEFQQLTPYQQGGLIRQLFFDELRAGGRAAAQPGPGHDNFTQAFTALATLFPGGNPDLSDGQTNPYSGDINLVFSRVYTRSGGNIDLLAPGGKIDVGQATPPAALGVTKAPQQLGIVAQGVGSVSAFAYGDEAVNQSRIFAADGGNILLWSTEGNIDAGRGSKSAISAPPPSITFDKNGVPTFLTPPALTGSGIQTLATTTGTKPGDVDLFAPHGVVNANDAGIVAGNLTIAATAVLGTNNITVSGTSVGVPVQVTGLGVAAAAAGSSGASATSAAQTSVSGSGRDKPSQAPIADAVLGWLDVFVLGFGEEQCAADNLDCLKRQQPSK